MDPEDEENGDNMIGRGAGDRHAGSRAGEADGGATGREREFVSAQWGLGGEGTGAPIHYHNSAWYACEIVLVAL